MFQTTVLSALASGVVGEIAFEGPLNAAPGILQSGSAANNVIGRAFTYVSNSAQDGDTHAKLVQAGGAGPLCGILANPKEYVSNGTAAGGTLAATMTLRNGEVGSFAQHTPGIYVLLTTAGNVGDQVAYATADGQLQAVAPGAAAPGGTALIPGAVVVREPIGAAGMAIIALNGPAPVTA